MSRFKTIDDVWDFLNAIPMFQKSGAAASNFSLENIRAFCDHLGNPQDEFSSIHIAGTNGKGTTAHLLEQVYAEAGYKTGLFTSPHLLRYHERFRLEKEEISDKKILEFFQKADDLLHEIPLSYFEISTALTFWFFADQQVDVGIIETGLGGRLDSTNIIKPELSIITSIGMDHEAILGDRIEKIALEKAGIIKQNTPVIVGDLSEKAESVIKEVSLNRNAQLYKANDLKPEWKSGTVFLNNRSVQLNTKFREAVNKWNIAMVWLAIEVLKSKWNVSQENLIRGIETFDGVRARFEKIHTDYDWFFSGAHNSQALESSLNAIKEMKPIADTVLVFSLMGDKLNENTLEYFKGFKEVYFIEQEGERAAKWSDVKDKIDATLLTESDKEKILNELKTELVIFMGSFYFYPIVKRWITNVS
ncbi:bifunctional folylpolyglutamate synthase/dihydrofolate synthase [Gracilimonas sp.]|uniref:bifunctional folylpolyglutamate synthase/dihydrofolate synthase n=1 Tax=Gracilimonas sp. TaxID=1974203 RepID=UPI002872932C|nr:Mur ligase family protein [Gracilimonas sp.]